jgi:hypothetical protein
MSPPAPTPSRERGRCPSCGQPLRSQRAVRHVRKSRLEFEGLVDTAVKARLAQLVGELAAKLETDREALEQPESDPKADAKRRVVAEAHHAEDVDKLRMAFRQF